MYLATTKTQGKISVWHLLQRYPVSKEGQFRTEGSDLENVHSPEIRIAIPDRTAAIFLAWIVQVRLHTARKPGRADEPLGKKESPIANDSEQNAAILFPFPQSVRDVLKAASLSRGLTA